MSNKLAINGGTPTFKSSEDAEFNWPIINKGVKEAILHQLEESISIYDNSGIFGELEKRFASDHDSKHALLFNSGTSAIHSMYFAINLKPGDKVLCPAYTFHATVSPMMHTGSIPVFCDSDKNGNISFSGIKNNYTDDVKAVVVTHMWGVPVKDIEKIRNFCSEKNIYLLEDCSHAHGATHNNSKVGTFGDMAAWSLQGQKIISGGEGGILITNSDDLYNRALLFGHYNKRPKNEISDDYELKEYYLTGFGLKLRAHPLAVAMISQQYEQLNKIISEKEKYAQKLINVINSYPFLRAVEQEKSQHSWYALPIRYSKEKTNGISREQFVEALHAEGMVEFDIPGSTGVINNHPLYTYPNQVFPHLYPEPLVHNQTHLKATDFEETLIKLPVWATKADVGVVEKYIEGIEKVGNYYSMK